MDMHGQIQRAVARLDGGGTLRKPRVNAAGFVEVDALLSRLGVYEYPQPDGTILYELRLEEEVFSDASLAGFDSVPVTREHPVGMVTLDNATEHLRGVVKGKPWRDGDHVAATLVIHDAELAQEVLSGKRSGTSPGYWADVVPPPKPMVVDGKHITGLQTNIRINHLAICEHPRGGDTLVRLDGLPPAREDGQPVLPTGAPVPGDEAMTTRRMQINNTWHEVPISVAEALEAESKQRTDSSDKAAIALKAAETEAGQLRARADSAEADKKKAEERVQKLDAELATARAPATLEPLVRARVDLETAAYRVLGATARVDAGEPKPLAQLNDDELRLAVLKQRKVSVKLDSIPKGQRSSFLAHRFDEEMEKVSKEERALERQRRRDAEAAGAAATSTQDAMVECPECEGEKVVDGKVCPECDGKGMVPEQQVTSPPPPTRTDAREPLLLPGYGTRLRQDAAGGPGPVDPKDAYHRAIDDAGTLPSMRKKP